MFTAEATSGDEGYLSDRGLIPLPAAERNAVRQASAALTPSARLIKELRDTGESFFDLALRMSATHKTYFLDLYAPDEARLSAWLERARASG